MTNPSHSTRFLLSWTAVGILLGLILVVINQHDDIEDTQPHIIHSPTLAPPASYAEAVNRIAPAVVSIQSYHIQQQKNALLPDQTPTSEEDFKIRPNKGSGVIIDPRGYIVTNNHVVAGASRIDVTLQNGERLEARILGLDPDTDLAVLTTDIRHSPVVSIADSDGAKVGDIVLAIGNPFGIGQTVTQGIISATGRDRVGLNTYENFLQTDAAINPGNSGGALINSQGEILGINAAIFSQSGNYLGISFAIPINLVLDVVNQIITNGSVIRGWLGVEGVDLNEQMLQRIGLPGIQGVLITDVFDGGPAEQSGIRVGDILTHINQQVIRDVRDVLNIIAKGRPGDNIEISGIRERQSFTSTAVLGQRPRI